jgi:hypothetical protein
VKLYSSTEHWANYDTNVAYRFFENVAQFRYLGTTITNQTFMQEKIKRRFNSDNETIILPVVLYGYETWSLTLR